MGTLYVVATPIGNLEDASPRSLRILGEVALIAAEDTRHTGHLLARFGISTPKLSYHAFNARARQERLLLALAEGDVALVSDAGTPGISDPGMEIVDAALDAGYPVVAIPGPSAVTAAISISGLIDGPFTFLGFLPRKSSERTELVTRVQVTGFGIVLFESPKRLAATIGELAQPFAGRRYAVVRELSKIYESVIRGRFDRAADSEATIEARGEIAVVIEGGSPFIAKVDPEAELRRMIAAGSSPNDAAKAVAAVSGTPKSELYAAAIRVKRAIESSSGPT